MKRTIFLLSLLILQLSLISAIGPVGENGIDIYVKNNTIEIKGYTIIGVPTQQINGQVIIVPQKYTSTTNALFINYVNENLGLGSYCNQFNYTSGNQTDIALTNCTYNINYYREVPFMNLGNISNQSQVIVTDTTMQDRYNTCVLERAQYSTSYSTCLTRETAKSSYESNYSTCTNSLSICNNQLPPLQTQIETLNKEKEDTKNEKFTWAIVAAILAGAGTMFLTGQWGRQKIKHPEENYNRSQSA